METDLKDLDRWWEARAAPADQRGAGLALDELLGRIRSWIWDWLTRRVPDEDVAADLTQEILIKVWEARRQLNAKRALGPWLLRITVNHYCDWRRRQHQDPLVEALPWEEDGPLENQPAEDPPLEEHAAQMELRRKVHTVITELPPEYREVLWFYYLEGLKCVEIAGLLGLTITQVEGRLFRGRAMLKTALKPLMED